MIRIRNTGPLGNVQITTEDGTPVHGVRSLRLGVDVGEAVTAELEVFVGAVDVTAHPLLGLETIEAAAAAHGYRLVKAE